MVVMRNRWWLAGTAVLAAVAAPIAGGCETVEGGVAALRIGFETMTRARLEDALRILQAAAAGPDDDGRIHVHLARTYEGLGILHGNAGATADAMRALEQGVRAARIAIERRADSSPYHTQLGFLYGELAAHSGVVGRVRYGRSAAASFAKALELDPQNPLAHVGNGIGKLETPPMFGGSATAALEEFRAAQALDPSCTEAWIWEGIAQRRIGATAEARRAFERALAVSPHNAHARRELALLEEDL
jgi:tetratricopeptide (TPR) repeat protein